ncbi:MAG: antibiotic resistance protein VanZ [Halobacterium sp.]
MTRRRLAPVAALVAVSSVVLAASLLPGSTAGGLPAGADKLLHAAGYAAVAGAAAWTTRARSTRSLVAVILLVGVLGAGVELLQPAVGRHASALDAAANLAGATVGVASWRLSAGTAGDDSADDPGP